MRPLTRALTAFTIVAALLLTSSGAAGAQSATVRDDARHIVSVTAAHRPHTIRLRVLTHYTYTTLTVVIEARRAGVVRRYQAFVFDESSTWKVLGPGGGLRCTVPENDTYGSATVTIRGTFGRQCFGTPGAIRFRAISEGDPGLGDGVLDRTAWSTWIRPS